nr:LysE family translocator [uncultured Acetobacter sp.]
MSFWSSFGPLTAFALVASITPGPNNTMLAASGMNHGFRRSIPHILGVTLGFVLMIGLVGLGLGMVFQQFPQLYVWLKYISAAYLLWLAWKIATAAPVSAQSAPGQPISFLQAAGFQWINPKAWIIAIGIVSAYLPHEHFLIGLALACLICGLMTVPCVSLWTGFGAIMRRWLTQPAILRGFNLVMATLLVASLYPLMMEASTR